MKTSKYQVLKTIALCVVLLAAARTGKAQIFPNSYINVDWQVGVPLGSAYAANMRGSQELTREERAAKGCNESASHVDFMFGTADLSVVGVREDGTELEIFRDGHWAL